MSIAVTAINSNCREELDKSINTGSYALGDMVAITATGNFSIVPGVSSPELTKYYNKYIITVTTATTYTLTLPAISQVAANAVKNGFSVYIKYINNASPNCLRIFNSLAAEIANLNPGFAVTLVANSATSLWTSSYETSAGLSNEILVSSSDNSPIFSNTISPTNVNIANNFTLNGDAGSAGQTIISAGLGNPPVWGAIPSSALPALLARVTANQNLGNMAFVPFDIIPVNTAGITVSGTNNTNFTIGTTGLYLFQFCVQVNTSLIGVVLQLRIDNVIFNSAATLATSLFSAQNGIQFHNIRTVNAGSVVTVNKSSNIGTGTVNTVANSGFLSIIRIG